jgi:hypothetical protein
MVAQDVRRTLEAVLQLPVLQLRFPVNGMDTSAPLDGAEDEDAAAEQTAKGEQVAELPDSTEAPAAPDGEETAEAEIDDYAAAVAAIQAGLTDDALTSSSTLSPGAGQALALWSRIFGWTFVHALGKLGDAADYDEQSRSWIDEWLLGRMIAGALQEVGLDEAAAARAVVIIKRLTSHQHWFAAQGSEGGYETLEALLRDSEMQQLLGVNRYQGVLWLNKQSFERLLWWLLLLAAIMISADPARMPSEVAEAIAACYRTVRRLRAAAAESGYQVEKLLELAQESVT